MCKQKQTTNQWKLNEQKSETYQRGGTGGDTGGEHMVSSQAKTERIVKDKRENKDHEHPHLREDQAQVEWSGEIISK